MTARLPTVVHVTWGGGFGGIERLVHDLASEQAAVGVEVSVAFGHRGGPFTALEKHGVGVIDLSLRSGYDLRPNMILRGARRLRCADVIHLHTFNVPVGAIVALADLPVVFTEHGVFGLGRRLGAKGHAKSMLQRLFLHRRVACIAANSRHTAARLSERYAIDQAGVTVVHNGIAVESSTPDSDLSGGFGRAEDLIVVFVGRLVRFKRVDLLLHAVARARGRTGMRVLLVGDGPLEAELRSLCHDLGLEDHVQFLGFRTDVASILSSADVLVQPSKAEPFGLAIAEACRAGVLPIAFEDGGGAVEVLPPDGIVVHDIDHLAATLDALPSSSALSRQARARRAAWAADVFPISRTAAEYERLYRRAIDEAAPSAVQQG